MGGCNNQPGQLLITVTVRLMSRTVPLAHPAAIVSPFGGNWTVWTVLPTSTVNIAEPVSVFHNVMPELAIPQLARMLFLVGWNATPFTKLPKF